MPLQSREAGIREYASALSQTEENFHLGSQSTLRIVVRPPFAVPKRPVNRGPITRDCHDELYRIMFTAEIWTILPPYHTVPMAILPYLIVLAYRASDHFAILYRIMLI